MEDSVPVDESTSQQAKKEGGKDDQEEDMEPVSTCLNRFFHDFLKYFLAAEYCHAIVDFTTCATEWRELEMCSLWRQS